MPCLRGIEVFLTTRPDNEKIPEYPHPEGTSARVICGQHLIRSPSLASNLSNSAITPPSSFSPRKANPLVSVYLPSVPGTPFTINYKISQVPPEPCKYLFFRLYINARPMVSWGIDPHSRPYGKVIKSLWLPSDDRYRGLVGFEKRSFVFLPGEEFKSVAEDGGLIEVQVFRAKDRRARTPKLETFRFRDNYGIAAPSIGLLDKPQNAFFYDWLLIDPKDEPFAKFRMHYRSWRNLKSLNLIPSSEWELLLAVSPKALRTAASTGKIEKPTSPAFSDSDSDDSLCSATDSDECVFDDHSKKTKSNRSKESPFAFLNSPPERFRAMAPSSEKLPQPSKLLRDSQRAPYQSRPLPELPVEAGVNSTGLNPPSVKVAADLRRKPSATSMESNAVSITPSLLRCMEEGTLDLEKAEVGIAKLVKVAASGSEPSSSSSSATQLTVSAVREVELRPPQPERKGGLPMDYSFSDYEKSSQSSFGDDERMSNISDMEEKPFPAPPTCYLPTTGSGLERELAMFDSPSPSPVPYSAMEPPVTPSPSSTPYKTKLGRKPLLFSRRLGLFSPRKSLPSDFLLGQAKKLVVEEETTNSNVSLAFGELTVTDMRAESPSPAPKGKPLRRFSTIRVEEISIKEKRPLFNSLRRIASASPRKLAGRVLSMDLGKKGGEEKEG